MEPDDLPRPPDPEALALAGLDAREIEIMTRASHPGNDTPDFAWSLIFFDAVEAAP